MDRRDFIALAGVAFPASLRALKMPEHHVVSANPLMVDFDISTLQGRYTAVEDFYVRNHGEMPTGGAAILRVEGEVERPLELVPSRLETFKKRKLGAVLECAGNPVATVGKVSNGTWEGWPFDSVLSLVRPGSGAKYLNLFGRDGYSRCVPITHAYEAAMLATHLNGEPLSRRHGSPWRALFPGWYGMDSVKWLERIVVSKTAQVTSDTAYLQAQQQPSGDIETQPLPRVRVKSLILSPEDNSVMPRGLAEVRGVAWSGQGPVSRVEISDDDGNHWRRADLASGTAYEWVLWRSSLHLTRPGPCEIICRATDAQGSTQPAERDTARLDGYANDWYHRVTYVII